MSRRKFQRLDLLRSWSIVLFLLLAVVWGVVWIFPPPDGPAWQRLGRDAGYAAAFLMLVPYLHILRRWRRYRLLRGFDAALHGLLALTLLVLAFRLTFPFGGRAAALTVTVLAVGWYGVGPGYRPAPLRMDSWLRWHIGASYLGFGFLLLHSRGHARTSLTVALQGVTWLVVVSGVVGFYGQRLLYRLFPLLFPDGELGQERLSMERKRLRDEAVMILTDLRALVSRVTGPADDKPLPPVLVFCQRVVERVFRPDFSLWRGLTRRRRWPTPADFAAVRKVLGAEQAEILLRFEYMAAERACLDREDLYHVLGRSWLLVHGPAAVTLLLLLIDHVANSARFGGY